jgi:hypothetical protein
VNGRCRLINNSFNWYKKEDEMRHLKKTALIGSAVAGALLLSSQAFAAPVTVDGIQFQPGQIIQIGSIYENTVTAPGQSLSGFGRIDEINGNRSFCAGGSGACELTFTFSGYTAQNVTSTTVDFSGGAVNFYADTSPNFDGNGGSMAAAGDGSLFLSTKGHTYLDTGSGRTGTLLAGGTNLDTNQPQGQGLGQLDVTGGDAAQYFNTNQINDFMGGNADLVLDSSFATVACPPNGEPVCGSGDVHNTPGMGPTPVPEPGELGLMGLGLLGLGFLFKRRRRS